MPRRKDGGNARGRSFGAGPCGSLLLPAVGPMASGPLLGWSVAAGKERSADTFGFWQGKAAVRPESTVQFGEG